MNELATRFRGRRQFLAGACAAATAGLIARPALALTPDGAAKLVGQVVADIMKIINSGKAEPKMLADFSSIFTRYGDVDIIARSALGRDARRASPAQLKAFTQAFTGYISRKYGRRFRELIGGSIAVKSSRAIGENFEVKTVASLKGEAPFEVIFLVSSRGGKDRFYDMLIEGVSLLRSEAVEIGAMIDKRRGDLDAMIADLGKTG